MVWAAEKGLPEDTNTPSLAEAADSGVSEGPSVEVKTLVNLYRVTSRFPSGPRLEIVGGHNQLI